MAISSKTRKILWGRSGNRCAICRHELTMEVREVDGKSVIGEECHIVARTFNGPRGNSSLTTEERDEYENLILLCRNDHKLIDDQTSTFTVERLQDIKSQHEEWVRGKLSSSRRNMTSLFFAYRVDSGAQIWNTVIGCDGHTFDVVQAKTEEEAHLLGDFTQTITDYGDILNAIESKDQILAQFEIDRQIKELNDNGFLVYVASRQHKYVNNNITGIMNILIGYTIIVREENPKVKRKDEETESLMRIERQTPSNFSNYITVMLDASSFRIA